MENFIIRTADKIRLERKTRLDKQLASDVKQNTGNVGIDVRLEYCENSIGNLREDIRKIKNLLNAMETAIANVYSNEREREF
jgi:vacuolar-type H+-ATPase subunit D/Vma8